IAIVAVVGGTPAWAVAPACGSVGPSGVAEPPAGGIRLSVARAQRRPQGSGAGNRAPGATRSHAQGHRLDDDPSMARMARTATLPKPIPAVDVGRDGRTGAGVDDAAGGRSAWPFGWSEEQCLDGYGSRCPRNELPMHSLLTRHAVQQLIRAGRTQAEVSAL